LFVVAAAPGLVRTVAGTSANGDGGPALGALLPNVAGISVNAQGFNQRVRRVDSKTQAIATIAGNGPGQVFTGGSAPATQVSIGVPQAITTAPNGDSYIAVFNRILKIDSTGFALGDGRQWWLLLRKRRRPGASCSVMPALRNRSGSTRKSLHQRMDL
jgi:hypothetical protein